MQKISTKKKIENSKRTRCKVEKKSKLWHRKSVPYLNEMIEHYGEEILKAPKFQEQDEYIQHGNITVRQHCMSVARASLKLDSLLHAGCDERTLIRGALLHDYFLYDWHKPNKANRWHGFRHPKSAFLNAQRHFDLSNIEKDVILKHMWPLTIRPPRYRESVIVCLVDKLCTVAEMLRIGARHYAIHVPTLKTKVVF